MKTRLLASLFVVGAVSLLAGCVNSEGTETAAKPSSTETVTVDQAASELVPADIREAGELTVGTHVPYPPNEYKDSAGEFSGWAVELTEAVGARLGLTTVWEEAAFEAIIPKIQENALDLGSASFTDNAERQKVVDFVNYYDAGVQWAAPKGAEVAPDDACGHVIAVKQGSFQHLEELPAKSSACEADGRKPIEILPFDDQAQTTNAVRVGKADAFSADSPVALDAIKQSDGELVPSGEAFDVSPYGFVLAKDSELTPAVQAALQSLMDDGTYLEILQRAGVEAGALETATINAGT